VNSGHAKLADWGLSHLQAANLNKLTDLGCGGGRNAGKLLENDSYRAVHGKEG